MIKEKDKIMAEKTLEQEIKVGTKYSITGSDFLYRLTAKNWDLVLQKPQNYYSASRPTDPTEMHAISKGLSIFYLNADVSHIGNVDTVLTISEDKVVGAIKNNSEICTDSFEPVGYLPAQGQICQDRKLLTELTEISWKLENGNVYMSQLDYRMNKIRTVEMVNALLQKVGITATIIDSGAGVKNLIVPVNMIRNARGNAGSIR